MAGEQFHIFIYGGSETVAHGRDFLREQDAELNRAMNEFMQGCKDEKEAFEQSVEAMGNQCYNSSQLHDDAKNITWKADQRKYQSEQCFSYIQGFVPAAEQMVNDAESILSRANNSIESCLSTLNDAKTKLNDAQSDIEQYERKIKSWNDDIKHYRWVLQNASDENGIHTAQSNIKQIQSNIESEREHPHTRQIFNARDEAQQTIDIYTPKLAAARQVKASAEAALAAAQSHLQMCRQKLSEAEALKRKAETLKQKTDNNEAAALKAYCDDDKKLRELKKTAKESARSLGELADNSLSIQKDASDNLCDNASIMDKLSGLMYDYETFSLDGGKL